jgi:hypothetical protein
MRHPAAAEWSKGCLELRPGAGRIAQGSAQNLKKILKSALPPQGIRNRFAEMRLFAKGSCAPRSFQKLSRSLIFETPRNFGFWPEAAERRFTPRSNERSGAEMGRGPRSAKSYRSPILLQRFRSSLQNSHHFQALLTTGQWLVALFDAVEKMLALHL